MAWLFREWTDEEGQVELMPSGVGSEHETGIDQWQEALHSIWVTIKLAQDYKDKKGPEKKALVLSTLKSLHLPPAVDAALPHIIDALVAAWKANPPVIKPKSGRRCLGWWRRG